MKNIFFLSLLILSTNAFSQWNQLGADIDGEAAGDGSGHSVSMPDVHTIAIGAPYHGGASGAGHVRVYSWNGTSWVQKGTDIDGEANSDQFGYSISMPDSNTVAIGANLNNGNGTSSGHVRIFGWNGSSWIQKGSDIDGEAAGDRLGTSVTMSDNNTVAVGAIFNDGGGSNSGHVRVYSWNGSSWVQKGTDIDGEAAGDRSGSSVSLADSNTLAIGAWGNDGNGSDAGHVRVYSWNGSSWVQKGSDIDGEAAGDQSGYSVSMPDINTLAIGALGNSSLSGHVRVYSWNGSSWIQKGSDIDGEAVDDRFGIGVTMSDSNTVAAGAFNNDGGGSNSGHVRVFSWNGSSWVQKGSDIEGEAVNDLFGYSVSLPDNNTVAAGAYGNDGNGSQAGHVRVFTCPSTTSSITETACDTFIAPSGKKHTSSGTVMDTIPNATGCDSVITINLTVNSSEAPTIIEDSFCQGDSFSFGGKKLTMNGQYFDTLKNVNNCDSVIELRLLYKQSIPITVLFDSICSNDSIFFGNKWNGPYTSGDYLLRDTMAGFNGCDSVINLNLHVKSIAVETRSPFNPINACNNELPFKIGDSTFTSSGFKRVVFNDSAVNGCDSILNFWLRIRDTNTTLLKRTRCQNDPFFFDGEYRMHPAGDTVEYYDTLPNRYGCDSFITLELIIDAVKTTTIDTFTCETIPYLFKGQNLYLPGEYRDTLQTFQNCDSFIILNLEVNKPSSFEYYHKFCSNDSVFFAGTHITGPGVYYDTILNVNRCDSFITMHLSKDTVSTTNINLTICPNDSLYFDNQYISDSGSYNMTAKSQGGCDSIVNLYLQVYPMSIVGLSRGDLNRLITDSSFIRYRWFFNEFPQSNAWRYYIDANNEGDYYVIATDSNNCSFKSNVLNYAPSSIEIAAIEDMSVYPIPAVDVLYIKSDIFLDKDVDLSILSIDGKIVNNYNQLRGVTEQSLDVSNLSSGLYFLQIQSKNYNIKRKVTIDRR